MTRFTNIEGLIETVRQVEGDFLLVQGIFP